MISFFWIAYGCIAIFFLLLILVYMVGLRDGAIAGWNDSYSKNAKYHSPWDFTGHPLHKNK